MVKYKKEGKVKEVGIMVNINKDKILASLTAYRKLDRTSRGINMVANSLLGHNKSSGPEPDLYTIYLTEDKFLAEYSRTSLHGSRPKKITKLDIPLVDIVDMKLDKKDNMDCIHIESAWGKHYYFEIENSEKKEQANDIIEKYKGII